MTVRLEEDVVFLEGACPVEDAETLIGLFDIKPDRIVDLTGCASLHAAIVQAVMVYGVRVRGDADDEFLRTWILPSLVGRLIG